jgi:hypothetical protein
MPDSDNLSQAFEHYRDASQRFEYFVLGVSVALVAYAGQTLPPQRIGLNAYTLEIIGILLIISAIVISFKRLEKLIFGLQINLHLIDSRESRGLLAKAFIEGGNRMASERGELWKPEDMKKQVDEYDKIIPDCEKTIAEVNVVAGRLYRWRNWLLICGFVALFFGRILEAYVN